MYTYRLHREQWVPRPLTEVFDFFSQAANLESLTPAWMEFRILSPLPVCMRRGALIEYALRVHGVPISWLTEIECWTPPRKFVDVQKKGPYRMWQHRHAFSEQDGGTLLIDDVAYALPFGPLGRLVHALKVRRDLELIFDYRERQIRERFA